MATYINHMLCWKIFRYTQRIILLLMSYSHWYIFFCAIYFQTRFAVMLFRLVKPQMRFPRFKAVSYLWMSSRVSGEDMYKRASMKKLLYWCSIWGTCLYPHHEEACDRSSAPFCVYLSKKMSIFSNFLLNFFCQTCRMKFLSEQCCWIILVSVNGYLNIMLQIIQMVIWWELVPVIKILSEWCLFHVWLGSVFLPWIIISGYSLFWYSLALGYHAPDLCAVRSS